VSWSKRRDEAGHSPEGAPLTELSELREVVPPASLVAAVMRRIAEPPSPPSLWQWLRRRHRIELRLSPLGAMAGLLALGTAAFLVVGPAFTRPPATDRQTIVVSPLPAAPAAVGTEGAPATTVVRFVLSARGARQVALAGNFNDWSPERTPLADSDGSGNFVATVALPPGTHEYMFVVDGLWVTDPASPERRPDGFGRENAILRL